MHCTMVGTHLRKLIIPWQSLSMLVVTEKILRRMLYQYTKSSVWSGWFPMIGSLNSECAKKILENWQVEINTVLARSANKKIHKCFHTHMLIYVCTHTHTSTHKHIFVDICLAWTSCMCGTWLVLSKRITRFPNHLQWLISVKNAWIIQLIRVTV